MYSESDIDGAVAAGVMPRDVAHSFRNFIAAERLTPAVDEEHFRLLSGFNDIFVTIAICLLLAAAAQIGGSITEALGGLFVAAISWGLAEYFTRRRRMALPSIVLLLTFVGGVAATLIGGLVHANPDLPERVQALIGAGVALVAAAAAWLHWRRFMVPITVAAGAVALVGVVIALVLAALPTLEETPYPLILIGGIVVFALAMRWDMSDRTRETRRADVAFWLHLAAAPMIAHPIFQMLGVFSPDVGIGTAAVVIALYLAFAVVALAVDRRAILVSGLIYVLYAMFTVFRNAGAVELGWALTAMVIGAALLMLSAFWHPMRRAVVGLLGSLGERLPPVQTALPA